MTNTKYPKQNKIIHNKYYILKINIIKYFQNINKNVLYSIILRKVKDEKLLRVIREVIFSTDGENSETGIAIGNYTSQTFANIYLNEMDQYAKHILELKYWYRYMDDMIAIVRTKQEAIDKLTKIRKFLKEKLDLELNSKTQIFKSKHRYSVLYRKLKNGDKSKGEQHQQSS